MAALSMSAAASTRVLPLLGSLEVSLARLEWPMCAEIGIGAEGALEVLTSLDSVRQAPWWPLLRSGHRRPAAM
jgi:hypothetical protein